MKMNNLTGKKFGMLTALSFERKKVGNFRRSKVYWKCSCDCSNEILVEASKLIAGQVSCGCAKGEKHGMSYTKIYRVWRGIIERCKDINNRNYQNYGGRGIDICERWEKSFSSFLVDMGNPPTKNHSIERIDNDGNYEPSNCRWATRKEQMNNKRNNVFLEYNGKTQTLSQWADEFGLPLETLRVRINRYKWSVDAALTTPINSHLDLIEINGVFNTLPEWAKKKNLPYKTVFARIKYYGWNLDRALNTPCSV